MFNNKVINIIIIDLPQMIMIDSRLLLLFFAHCIVFPLIASVFLVLSLESL